MKKLLFTSLFLFLANLAIGQLSPGKLSRVHENLEGVKNCTQCHEVGQQVSADRCLSCHTGLQEQIKQGRGLHARADYKQCETCHVEHQGSDFDLVYWKNGRDNFDHSLTGYQLEGKHNKLDCRKCHQSEHIIDAEKLRAQKANLKTTYLGMSRECLGCHPDEHRGQFKQNCTTCHNMDGWKPAPGFDHAQTKYPLTGKHAQVACEKCHRLVPDNKIKDETAYVRYGGIEFGQCTPCHKDVHNDKLGANCQRCHSTSDWQDINKNQFNHDQTAYPLRGRHSSVDCEKCHLPGKPLKGIHFGACMDCHSDYHNGQFAKRARKGACEECHTVQGFSPADFTVAQHEKTSYPLAGSHLAVPCNLCHTKTAREKTIRFSFGSTHCAGCHKDPHKGELNRYIQNGGCEFCHQAESWQKINFDHGKTKFALLGKHEKVACNACHKKETVNVSQENHQFAGLGMLCNDCHEDVHRGQFNEPVAALQNRLFSDDQKSKISVNCDRCHTPSGWAAEKFDHNRDARFKLDGAHKTVPCNKCHRQEIIDNKSVVRYKPLDFKCSDCHTSGNKM